MIIVPHLLIPNKNDEEKGASSNNVSLNSSWSLAKMLIIVIIALSIDTNG